MEIAATPEPRRGRSAVSAQSVEGLWNRGKPSVQMRYRSCWLRMQKEAPSLTTSMVPLFRVLGPRHQAARRIGRLGGALRDDDSAFAVESPRWRPMGYSTIASEIISPAVSSAFEATFCVGRMAKRRRGVPR